MISRSAASTAAAQTEHRRPPTPRFQQARGTASKQSRTNSCTIFDIAFFSQADALSRLRSVKIDIFNQTELESFLNGAVPHIANLPNVENFSFSNLATQTCKVSSRVIDSRFGCPQKRQQLSQAISTISRLNRNRTMSKEDPVATAAAQACCIRMFSTCTAVMQ